MGKRFKLDITVDKTTVAPREPIKTTATFKNLSDSFYQVVTGLYLIGFGIFKKDEERLINEITVAVFRTIDKNLTEVKTMEHSFKDKGEYCIMANAKFRIISTDNEKQIEYEKIKISELEQIYLVAEEITINVN